MLETSPGMEVIAQFCACRVSYFTPVSLRKVTALLWHCEDEDLEIYNHALLWLFPELCRVFFPVNSTWEAF